MIPLNKCSRTNQNKVTTILKSAFINFIALDLKKSIEQMDNQIILKEEKYGKLQHNNKQLKKKIQQMYAELLGLEIQLQKSNSQQNELNRVVAKTKTSCQVKSFPAIIISLIKNIMRKNSSS